MENHSKADRFLSILNKFPFSRKEGLMVVLTPKN